MKRWLYRSHILFGVVCALPLLGWASSGLVSLWPSVEPVSKIEAIDAEKIKLSPAEALAKADALAGKHLPITALTLVVKDGHPVYQAIGGMGAGSILVNAQSGEAIISPPPKPASRFFSEAHFFYFAGRLQVPIMVTGCVLACAVALSGLLLAIRKLRRIYADGSHGS